MRLYASHASNWGEKTNWMGTGNKQNAGIDASGLEIDF